MPLLFLHYPFLLFGFPFPLFLVAVQCDREALGNPYIGCYPLFPVPAQVLPLYWGILSAGGLAVFDIIST